MVVVCVCGGGKQGVVYVLNDNNDTMKNGRLNR